MLSLWFKWPWKKSPLNHHGLQRSAGKNWAIQPGHFATEPSHPRQKVFKPAMDGEETDPVMAFCLKNWLWRIYVHKPISIYLLIYYISYIYWIYIYIYTYTEYTYVYRPVPPIPIKESCGFIRAHRPPSCQSTFTAPLEVSGGDEVVTPRHQRTSKTMVNIPRRWRSWQILQAQECYRVQSRNTAPSLYQRKPVGTGTVSGCQSFQTWAVPGSNSHPKQSALALS